VRLLTDLKLQPTHNPAILTSVMMAYIKFRPDVGYVTPMFHVLDTLITNMYDDKGDDYKVFSAFANLVHSRHLIEFYIGNEVVDFRLRFFNAQIARHAPRVAEHFE
jgi:hypothetical protein